MPKNSYKGTPIDATMQYIRERSVKSTENGETVAGTSDDDMGDERTRVLPDEIDTDEYTDTQLEWARQRIQFPDSSLKEFCEVRDYDYPQVSGFLSQFRREHKEVLRDHGQYENLVPPSKRQTNAEESEESEEIEREKEKVREYYRQNPDAGANEAKEATGVSLPKQSVASLKQYAVDEPNEAEIAEVEQLETRLQSVEEAIAEMQDYLHTMQQYMNEVEEVIGTNQSLGAEIDRNTAYKIVAGEMLTDEERRQVFDAVIDG